MATNRDSGTRSPWQATKREKTKAHSEDYNKQDYDVLIIGAGITGISTALALQQKGKNCLVIEGHTIGFGTTGGTSAHINTFFDCTYPEIDSGFGQEASKLIAAAGVQARDKIAANVRTYNIDCQFEHKTGYLFSEDEKQTKQLSDILKSSANAGVTVSEAATNGLPIPFERSLEFATQAQFHPMYYVRALADEFTRLGGTILEHTFIDKVETEDGIHTASCRNNSYSAANLVYATHVPPGITRFSFRCAPYRSYVLGATLSDEKAYPNCMAYDMQEPYHYFRSHVIDGKPLLLIGGADHKTGHDDPEKAYSDLESYARKYFDIKKVDYRWSSQYYVPADGLPYIGELEGSDKGIFVATGFNGNGMTWGTISAQLISDLILENENPYATLLSPTRLKPVAGFSEFVRENADVAYHFISDRFRTQHLDSLSELENGEGRVVDLDGEKLAVYRDSSGMVSALDPTCTHAGCTVCFNPAEKSWDCPCHGARFDLSGKVLCGPPRKDLVKINLGTNTSADE